MPDHARLSTEEVVDQIIETNDRIRKFWSRSHGWVSAEAAKLLSKSRLDWQVELSRCLRLWIDPFPIDKASGCLILGYANLGSLVEGTMMLFLSVHYMDYRDDVDAVKDKEGNLLDPEALQFDALREFIKSKMVLESSWDAWLRHLQQRRNAIHSFRDRDIGTHKELLEDMRTYHRFMERIDTFLPYPEEEGDY
jgi:hypothetical protein